jgi:hypothetical protein
MKYIAGELGDRGVAAVYRLYEVFTERFGVDDDFSGSLFLSPPFSEQWLANEIFTPSDDERMQPYFSGNSDADELPGFLSICETAGIIELKRQESEALTMNEETGVNEPTGKTRVWLTVTIPGFAKLSDVYAHRKSVKSNALETTR